MNNKTTQTIGNGLKNLIANVPLALLALPASYGAARFSEKVYQEPVNWVLGGAFESAYTGAIFFAQKKSRYIFMLTVASAVICGVIYNTLWAATTDTLLDNQFWAIRWLIALIHGAPLSVLAFAYAMLMHKTSDAGADADAEKVVAMASLQDQKLEKLNEQIQQDLQNITNWLQGQFQSISDQNEQSLQIALTAIYHRIDDSVEVQQPDLALFQEPENIRQFNAVLPQVQSVQSEEMSVKQMIKHLVETEQITVSEAVKRGITRATAASWLSRARARAKQQSSYEEKERK